MPKTAPHFDLASVRARLPGRRIDWFQRLGSTMLEAASVPEPGRIVVAEEQTAGIGRHGRSWHSEPSTGLYVSIVLAARAVPVVMLALGLATRDAITQTTSLQPDLRWPNDVLIHNRKCAGILANVGQAILSPASADAIIAGIGINVSQITFPEDFDTPPTSLLLEGARVTREDLLVALAISVDRHCALAPPEILRRFAQASSFTSGRRVRVETAGTFVEGVTCGLDPAGFLRLREDSGRETTILAGGIRPV